MQMIIRQLRHRELLLEFPNGEIKVQTQDTYLKEHLIFAHIIFRVELVENQQFNSSMQIRHLFAMHSV